MPLYRFQESPPPPPPILATQANFVAFNVNYQENFEIYSAELNQICQWERVTVVGWSALPIRNFPNSRPIDQSDGRLRSSYCPPGPVTASTSSLFQRETAYAYLTVKPLENLWLTGGAAGDHETFPNDFRQPPIAAGEATSRNSAPRRPWSGVRFRK